MHILYLYYKCIIINSHVLIRIMWQSVKFTPFPPNSDISIPGLSLQLSHDAKGRCSWPPVLPRLQAMQLPSEPRAKMPSISGEIMYSGWVTSSTAQGGGVSFKVGNMYSASLKPTHCVEIRQVSLGRHWIRKSNKFTKNMGRRCATNSVLVSFVV